MASIYPPPPPGWDKRALAHEPMDPIAARRALDAWIRARGYEINPSPDVSWFQGWAPFVYLFHPVEIGREIRAKFSDAWLWIAELFAESGFGKPRQPFIVYFLTSERLQHRAAIRSRLQPEAIEEMRAIFNARRTPSTLSRWRYRERQNLMRRTYGRAVRGAVADAVFEAHFEIATPTREEGLLALPLPLRQLLVQSGWRGILECRPGGLVATTYGPPRFEPQILDGQIAMLSQIYATIMQNACAPPPPTSGPASSTR
jgi:hypothetical protein